MVSTSTPRNKISCISLRGRFLVCDENLPGNMCEDTNLTLRNTRKVRLRHTLNYKTKFTITAFTTQKTISRNFRYDIES